MNYSRELKANIINSEEKNPCITSRYPLLPRK